MIKETVIVYILGFARAQFLKSEDIHSGQILHFLLGKIYVNMAAYVLISLTNINVVLLCVRPYSGLGGRL